MKTKLLLISGLALLILGSCQKDPVEKKLDTDILVSAEMDEQNVVVVAESEVVYPCCSHQVSYTLQKKGQTYIIKFTDIPESLGGIMMPDRARARIEIGRLSAANYPVIFELNGSQTNATLVVDTAATIQIRQLGNVRVK